jgi:hypothetical protein
LTIQSRVISPIPPNFLPRKKKKEQKRETDYASATVNGRIATDPNRIAAFSQTSGLPNTPCGLVSLALDAGAVRSSASMPESTPHVAHANHLGANVFTQPQQSE